jgi:DNA-binding SARP family transcriptional activator
MEFRILGALEVRDGDRTIPLASGRQRALLALLILHANETVSTDRLVEELWGEHAPATASKVVQNHVSHLRRALANGLLVTRSSGYALELAPGQLDLDRFEELLERGRRALASGDAPRATELLREALALWRGPPLADFAFEPFAQPEIARLEERRLIALEERIEADLALGRHADLVGELESLIAKHPLRERLRGQLMQALYRSRRQAEALAAYQAARRALVDELGIEPSPELQQLERSILRQDSALDLRAPLEERDAKERGNVAGPLIGRARELAKLLEGLEGALSGQGRLFLIAGEPGIGKSRLADELSTRARARGARVLVGRCWEAGGAPAFWPWVQALRTYISEAEADALRAELGRGAADVAQILPELREILTDLPAPPSLESEGARFRVFDAMASFLRKAATSRPLVIALDDLHAADAPSLLLLQFVAGELAESRIVILGCYRDVDPTLADPLTTALTELAREPVTRTLALAGLPEPDVARFIELTSGKAPGEELVATIHEETEGNPLFIGEIVRLMAAEGRLGDAAATRLALPQSVKEVIGRRLRHLTDECTHVLTLASVLGREFDLDALASVTGLERDTLLELLDEAMAARVVAETAGVMRRLCFAHALIRDVVYEAPTSARRAQLHRQVGEALEDLYAGDLEPHLAELAHHFFEAASAGDGEAIDYARRAGERAVSLLAFEEAVPLYRMALQLTDYGGTARCDLLLALGEAQARAGDTPAAKSTFREAAELAASQGLHEQLARAALGYGGRFIWDVSRDDAHLVPLLERALTALGDQDSILRVRLLARLAGGPLRDSTADAERRRSLGAQALEMARRIGEPSTLAYALLGYISSRHSPDFTPEQAEIASELVQVALQARDLERAVEGYDSHLVASIELGDLPAAYADLEAMTSLAEELLQPAQRWLVTVYRALLALLEGRFEEAEQLITETRSLGERALGWNAAAVYGLQLYVLRREQGRVQEVEKLVRRAATDNPTYPIWRSVLANMLAELGSTGEARTELEALAADDFSRLPFDEEWEVSMCLLAETAARLGDSARAATLYDRLLPYAGRVTISYPEISLGPVSRFLGILATATAHWDDAERHFRDSLEVSTRIGARPSLAHTQTDYAQMLLEREEPSSSDKAWILLDQALATYRELGMDSHFLRAVPLRERATTVGPA